MQIVAFEELEQHAREEYRKRFGKTSEPKVINASAWATFGQPRSLVWGGLVYWAPPLSYEDGVRCMIAANALRDRPSAHYTAKAILLARSLMRRQRPSLWRLRARLRELVAFHVYRPPTEEVRNVLHWLMHVPDEATYVPPEKPGTIDLIGNRYAFELAYHRRPDSWADYVYGMRELGRRTAQEDFRNAVSTRVGSNADEKGWKEYERDQRAAAGWSNG
jgi:hypothetical protein